MNKLALIAAMATLAVAPTFVLANNEPKIPKYTVTGCLTGPTDDGTFMLKRVKAGDVQVGGLADLQDHVGQEVRIKGLWVKSGSQIGEKENAAAKVGDKIGTRRHFRATDVDKIADSCESLHH